MTPPRWGNSRGLSTLEKLDQVLGDTQALKTKISVIEPQLEQANESITILQKKVDVLSMSSDAYLKIRNRFLSVYRRDVARNATAQDQKIIKEGNSVAHYGDPLADSELFRSGCRTDDKSFLDLYGLHWSRALIYKENVALLRVLSVHATARADANKPIEPEIERAFTKLIDALEDGGYQPDAVDDEGSAERRAYWEFWDVWGKTGRRAEGR